MRDEVTLVIPADEDFRSIVHLVVGGLAVRLGLTMDALEDLQVALDALLARRDDMSDVHVRMVFDDQTMRAAVGPLPSRVIEDLERDSDGLGLRRVLETVCDTHELEQRDDGTWVELTKRLATVSGT